MKKVMKWMFALSLSACMTVTAMAAQKLPAPSWARWGSVPGQATWEVIPASEGEYRVLYYKDGEEFTETNWKGNSRGSEDFYYKIYDSGNYTFKVMAKGDGTNNSNSDYSPLSSSYQYVKPSVSFGEVKNLRWSSTDPNVALWDAPDGVGDYGKYLNYRVTLYEDGTELFNSWGFKDTQYDMRKEMTEEAVYTFSVEAISSDIEKISHGKIIFSDGSVNVPEQNDKLEQDLNDFIGLSSPSDALKQLEDKWDISEMAVSMQSSENIRSLIADLETLYLEEKGGFVETVVSDEVGIDPSDIQLLGAGLNLASSSNSVKFNVQKPDKEANVDSSLYKNTFQVDLSLDGAVDTLRVPITITMPIPEGIKPSRLSILHYKKDGSYELLHAKVNEGEGTVSFTVTDFSTFVFAEKVEGGAEDDSEDSGSSGSSGSSGAETGRPAGGQNTPGTWVMSEGGWQFKRPDGSLVMNDWVRSGNVWYFVGGTGVISTKWILWNGHWYYLNPDQGETLGSMSTGWIYDQDFQKWFYLSQDGIMKDGWQSIDGKWYYFNTNSDGSRGAMAASTVIDGYQIGSDGVWIP